MGDSNWGSSVNRRRFLTVSGAVLGGIATGTTVAAAEQGDRFIVDTKGRASRRRLERAGLDVVFDLEPIDVVVVEGDESAVAGVTGDYAPDVSTRLDLPVDAVGAADPGSVVPESESATDEPFYAFQWDKQALDVPSAHDVTRGEGTRVAVIDTGVDGAHEDLQHAVNTGLSRNFTGDGGDFTDVDGHGTHVSGIVAANDRNEAGVVGTAPATDLVACRVFDEDLQTTFATILAAIVYSVQVGCDAANLSIGAYPVPRQGLGSFYGGVLNRTTTFANREGTLVVVSAGNDAADLQHDGGVISLPNEAAQALSISATGPIGFGFTFDVDDVIEPPESPANYTNYGTNAVTLGAPGGDYDTSLEGSVGDIPVWAFDLVFNTYPGDSYAWLAGTSMAAPQVTGAAALVRSQNPGYNANQVESALERAADVPDGFDKAFYGSGFLNIVDAL